MLAFNVDVLSFADWAAAWSEPVAADMGAACLYQSPSYLSVWLDTVGRARGTEPVFLRVDTADGQRVMLLALGLERRRGLKVLTFLEGGVVDYAGPVRLGPAAGAIDAARARVLWAAVCGALPPFDVAVLERMPPEIEGAANPLRHLGVEMEPSNWALTLEGGFADFQRTSWGAQDLRRKRRRLQDVGPVSFEIAREPSVATRFLEAMIAQKTKKYLATLGQDGFEGPGHRDYFARFTAHQAHLGGMVHLSALTVGDEIVATHWGLVSEDTFYWLMPSYAEGPLARFSPGRILMEENVAWCYANGVRRFDFGRGDEAYKAQLGARRSAVLRVEAPASLAGRAALAALAFRRSAAGQSLAEAVSALRGRRAPRPVEPA